MNIAPSFENASTQGFHLVEPTDTAIISQLLGSKRDKVHPAPTDHDGFYAKRGGSTSHNRQVRVRVDEYGQVTAALYSACFYNPITKPQDFHGDVASILRGYSTRSDVPVQSVIFYSVGAWKKGEGAKLIRATHADITANQPQAEMATLSPLRGFAEWCRDKNISRAAFFSEEFCQKRAVMAFLAADVNAVQKFHIGVNGANLADIKTGSNALGSEDDVYGMNVMINYGYPDAESFERNKVEYKRGRLVIAEHLQPYISSVRNFTVHRPAPCFGG